MTSVWGCSGKDITELIKQLVSSMMFLLTIILYQIILEDAWAG